MERQEFLSKLGLGLMIACTGCGLASCGSKGGEPAPPKQSGNLFTIDLSSQITNVGDSTVEQGIIVVRLAAGNSAEAFTAVQVACTHRGTSIGYNLAQGIFICPAHGSEFNTDGAVIKGPASAALEDYKVAVSGNNLTVSA